MPTYYKWGSETLKHLEEWEKYLSRQFIDYYIGGALLGLFMGVLAVTILTWRSIQKYPEIASVATTYGQIIIYAFILLMIFILLYVYRIYRDTMERKKFFEWLKKIAKDYTEMLGKEKLNNIDNKTNIEKEQTTEELVADVRRLRIEVKKKLHLPPCDNE